MKTFTIVGLYKDNKQVYVTSLEAKNPHMAAEKAKVEVSNSKAGKAFGHRINVLSVFEGEHRDLYGEADLIED